MAGGFGVGRSGFLLAEQVLLAPRVLARLVAADALLHAGGSDLPGQAVAVLEPAALALFPAVGGELLPVVVDPVLVRAGDAQGERLRELEVGPAGEGGGLLAVEHEPHRQRPPGP